MFPKQQIDGFEKYWRRRKPASSTAVHYASDVSIFFKWLQGRSPESVTVHDVDEFIEWQHSLGRAPATIRRRLIALRMFYEYLAFVCEVGVSNPVVPQRHYIGQGYRLPRDIRQDEVERLFTAIGDHLRDRTVFTLMLHTGLRVGELVHGDHLISAGYVLKSLNPGTPGIKRWLKKFCRRLVLVRYRGNPIHCVRSTTVQIAVDGAFWDPEGYVDLSSIGQFHITTRWAS